MGHVGKQNIYISWPFVYSIILNYMVRVPDYVPYTATNLLKQISTFFEILPSSWRLFGVI